VQAVRYIVVLLAGFLAGSHAVDAAHSWQEWHTWAVRDPSGAEAYRAYFLVSLAVALLSLSIAALVWWLLRPKEPSCEHNRT
jgi:ABC-type sulfate transport system permease component